MIFWKMILMDESLGPSNPARSRMAVRLWMMFTVWSSHLFLVNGFFKTALLSVSEITLQVKSFKAAAKKQRT